MQPKKYSSHNENRKTKNMENDIEFDQIVKFLNAQKAVMDYMGLN